MLKKKFVYMSGMHSTGSAGRDYGMPPADENEDGTDGADDTDEKPFNIDEVKPNTLPDDARPGYDKAKAAGYVKGMVEAYMRGDTAAFLSYSAQLGAYCFEYDVEYSDAVLEYFGEFENGLNSIRASMQGFSTDKGKYRLTQGEYDTLMMAKNLLEASGYSLDDIEGGEIVQKLLDGYEKGEDVEISKHDANKVMQFVTQMETKILPSNMKQEVLAANLEATNEKRKAYYSTTVPGWINNAYNL